VSDISYGSQLSVIIASIGRRSLLTVVQDIARDWDYFLTSPIWRNQDTLELCIYLDTPTPDFTLIASLEEFDFVRIVFAKEVSSMGPAFAYNKAKSISTGDFFSFFSDDDTWLQGRIATIFSFLRGKKTTLLQMKSIYHDGEIKKVRPKKFVQDGESFLNLVFGYQNPFRRNLYYVSLISIAGSADLLKIDFRSNLTLIEDLLWLTELIRENPKLHWESVDKITSQIQVNLQRSGPRINDQNLRNIENIFREYGMEHYSHYYWQHLPRPAATSGDMKLMMRIKDADVAKKGSDRIVFSGLLLVCCIQNFLKSIHHHLKL